MGKDGVWDGCGRGILLGFPLIGAKIEIESLTGLEGEVPSDPATLRMAASDFVRGGARAAAPVLLEPQMSVQITTSDRHVGSVLSDLTGSRRGRVHELQPLVQGRQVVEASVPLSSMLGYATALRSLTKGEASFTMALSDYMTM